jgi:hypothetical protein
MLDVQRASRLPSVLRQQHHPLCVQLYDDYTGVRYSARYEALLYAKTALTKNDIDRTTMDTKGQVSVVGEESDL